MSSEEAHRAAQERDAAAIEAAAAERQRTTSWNSIRMRSSSAIPPAPTYLPPPPPGPYPSGQKSPEAQATIERAEREARRTELNGVTEEDVPERVLRTTVTTPGGTTKHSQPPSPGVDRRDPPHASAPSILPVVEEAQEGGSTGDRTRNSHVSSLITESDGRPLTPAKDGLEPEAGFGNPLLGGRGIRGPPTPPKMYGAVPKPESADSGYGVTANGNMNGDGNGDMFIKSGTGSQRSGTAGKVKTSISRNSLDKALPPLPMKSSQSVGHGML